VWKNWAEHRAQNEVVVNEKVNGDMNEELGESRGYGFSPPVSDTSSRFFCEPFVNVVKRGTNLETPVLF
jgi:hypothetical protein